MGLLATLGLTPVVMGVATQSTAARNHGTGGDAPASVNQWQATADAHPPKEIATPYGPYYADWLDEAAVVPAMAATLAALPKGRDAHEKATAHAARLAKVVKQVEAGPNTPAAVAAEVKRHASGDATNAAETFANSSSDFKLLSDLIRAADGQLRVSRSEWDAALQSQDIVSDRWEAATLKAEVEEEKKRIDESLALFKSIYEIGSKSLKGEAADVVFEVLELAADAYNGLQGRDRLARAGELEAQARSAEMLNLAQRIATAGDKVQVAMETMDNLHDRVREIRKALQRQRLTAVAQFDEGSKGKTRLKLIPIMQALEAASTLRELAARSAAHAKSADRAIDAVLRAHPTGRANEDACERVIAAMRQETNRWAVAAEQNRKHCDALTARYRLLCDTAIDAMKGSVKGRSIDELMAL